MQTLLQSRYWLVLQTLQVLPHPLQSAPFPNTRFWKPLASFLSLQLDFSSMSYKRKHAILFQLACFTQHNEPGNILVLREQWFKSSTVLLSSSPLYELTRVRFIITLWDASVLFVMLAPTNKNVVSICIETFTSTQAFISFSQIPRDGISWYILGYVYI